jgi:hypothetical protein
VKQTIDIPRPLGRFRGNHGALSRVSTEPAIAATDTMMDKFGMKKPMKFPPVNLANWVEFCWLLLIDPTFQASRNKRKTYFDYRLARRYNTPFD